MNTTEINILRCLEEDVDNIRKLYDFARTLQRSARMVVWPDFSRSFLESEIMEGRQWKLLYNHTIACNWTVAYEDKEIWETRDQDNAVYIHRIATHPDYRGNRLIDNLVEWAKQHAIEKQRKFVRLDTLGNNTRLIEHYISAGFSFLGMNTLTNTSALPLHYQLEPRCCLFEISL